MRVTHGFRPPSSIQPCALTIGNFDGIHLGHQAVIAHLTAMARTLGLSATLLTFEPHPREYFDPAHAPARLTSLREKLELLANLGLDRVHICRFSQALARMQAADFVTHIVSQNLAARWVLVGDDFRYGAGRQGDLALLQKLGQTYGFEAYAEPAVIIDNERVSSTTIRSALACGELLRAQSLLGRPYAISGRVVHGDKTGRKLGFPTANIQLKHNKPPLSGIFAVELRGLGHTVLRGVASLGVRPTIYDDGKPTLEVFIFDFNRDIYRHHVQVSFLHKLRDEAKYPDLEILKRNIALDVENAKLYFEQMHV